MSWVRCRQRVEEWKAFQYLPGVEVEGVQIFTNVDELPASCTNPVIRARVGAGEAAAVLFEDRWLCMSEGMWLIKSSSRTSLYIGGDFHGMCEILGPVSPDKT